MPALLCSAMEDNTVPAFGIDFQRHLGRLDQGHIMVDMPDWCVERYRIVVFGHHVAYHALHVGMIVIGLVISELPYHETAQFAEHSAQFELIEYALYLIDRLGHILYKEYRVGLDDIVGCADKFGEHGYIAAIERARGKPGAVVGMAVEDVHRPLALQDIEECRDVGVVGAALYAGAHQRMYARYAFCRHKCMKRRYVAEAGHPLWVVGQRQLVEAIEDMHHAVAAAAA